MEKAATTTASIEPEIATLTPRAIAIAKGLRRSGRVGDLRAVFSGTSDDGDGERWLVLPTRGEEFYFISRDGEELRRGEDFIDAEPLQAGFLAVLAKIGGLHEGVDPTKS